MDSIDQQVIGMASLLFCVCVLFAQLSQSKRYRRNQDFDKDVGTRR